MAIARGAGTEILRTAHFEDIDGSVDTKLIVGVQHHIYTILSINVYVVALNAATDKFHMYLKGYDSKGGATAQNIAILAQNIPVDTTFIWNDKFSFNGYEPVNFGTSGITAAPLSAADQQDAIADQGSGVAQKLCISGTSGDLYDINITFIDQNNA